MAKYTSVNGQWPVGDLPVPTAAEAMSGARRLYRLGMGRPWTGKVKLTSGRRNTWVRSGVLYVNPNGRHFGGWRDIVHDLSHYVHWRKNPDKPGHGFHHAFIEREMVEQVVRLGWLEGKLKRPEKPKTPVVLQRQARVQARLKAWRTKLKRAQTEVKKLEIKARYYDKETARLAA